MIADWSATAPPGRRRRCGRTISSGRCRPPPPARPGRRGRSVAAGNCRAPGRTCRGWPRRRASTSPPGPTSLAGRPPRPGRPSGPAPKAVQDPARPPDDHRRGQPEHRREDDEPRVDRPVNGRASFRIRVIGSAQANWLRPARQGRRIGQVLPERDASARPDEPARDTSGRAGPSAGTPPPAAPAARRRRRQGIRPSASGEAGGGSGEASASTPRPIAVSPRLTR